MAWEARIQKSDSKCQYPTSLNYWDFQTKQKANSAEKKKTEFTEISIDHVILATTLDRGLLLHDVEIWYIVRLDISRVKESQHTMIKNHAVNGIQTVCVRPQL